MATAVAVRRGSDRLAAPAQRLTQRKAVVVAVIATVFAWPVASVLAGPDLDSGYRYGLTAWACAARIRLPGPE